jgi:hypothetical protein
MDEQIRQEFARIESEIQSKYAELLALVLFPIRRQEDDAPDQGGEEGVETRIPNPVNDQLGVDGVAAPDFLGAAYNDGVLHIGACDGAGATEQNGLRWEDLGNYVEIAHQDAPGSSSVDKDATSNNAVVGVQLDSRGHVYAVKSGQPWKTDPVYPTVETLWTTDLTNTDTGGDENDLQPGAVWYGELSGPVGGKITLTNKQMCMPI